ncbi:MAG: tRNA-(ms[2]io[6]A)-hydroxylase [Planctomycetes bacterium]|nr:tRNA-(ms[2]io[6]A)-hydroxylase [Planctomycetota bacterium]
MSESVASADLPPLPYRTPPQWAARWLDHRDELLVEQAHLEKKAAAAALSFLFRLPADPALQRGLSALAREELVHFERTLKLLGARGIPFGPLAPCPYAAELKRAVAATMPERLVDELLVSAIIEARSCERMQCLAQVLAPVDAELAGFYSELVAAEARHADLYQEAAATLVPPAVVALRWQRLGAHEARVLRGLPAVPRLLGGSGDDALGGGGGG